MALKIGTTVTLHEPGSATEHESWERGTISATLSTAVDGSTALHLVSINAHKWKLNAPWGPYDGVPEVLARERKGDTLVPIYDELEFIDTWPRRKPSGEYFLTADDFRGVS